jgi:endoribonuclease Nob1
LKVVLLDTSSFIQGYNMSQEEKFYTVPQVNSEIRDEIAKIRYEGAKNSGRMKEEIPIRHFVTELESQAEKMGEKHKLSTTDKQLLALGLQLKNEGNEIVIVSDDYSVQNMASKLGMKYVSQVTKGITRRLNWIIYCPGCRKTFDTAQEDNTCPICGTPLKRKPRR